MNILKSIVVAGISISALCSTVAEMIPAKAITVPAGCSRLSASEYVVRVAKRNDIPNTTAGLVFKPDMKLIAGKAVKFSADLRSIGIASDVSGEHVGGKILISYKDGSGMRFYATPSLTGTSAEWQNFSHKLEIPADAAELTVTFGIQQGYGTLEVRNPRMDFVTFGLPADGAKTPIPMDDIILGGNAKVNGDILTVNIPKRIPMPNQTLGGSVRLNLDNMREKVIRISCKCRYDVYSDTTGFHIGAKILSTSFDRNTGTRPSWHSSEPYTGKSDDWKDLNLYLRVYDSTTAINLIFGIQQGWGKAEFRDLAVEVVSPIDGTPGYNVPAGFKCEYSPEVLAAAPRRGFMTPVPALIKEDDVREMGKWGANLIRYQMVVGIEHEPENVAEYMKWLNGCLDKLDSLMPALKENNIKVVIDMHQPVGGRFKMGKRAPQTPEAELACKITGKADLHRIFAEADMRQAFIDAWKMIAARYKDNPVIFGYDLVNEPATVGQTPYHWADVQFDAAKAIREIDPETPIIVEGNRCASPIYFNMRPMPLKNIIYEIHMYFPGDYCFQGVYDKAYANEYPKRAVYYSSNREELRKAMAAVIEFQKKYGAKIFVGEFTVPRWVPDGGGKYLDDLISLYEDYKWDWTFHAFREWDGFSPEHYGAPNDPKIGDNERKSTLQKYFKRNVSEE